MILWGRMTGVQQREKWGPEDTDTWTVEEVMEHDSRVIPQNYINGHWSLLFLSRLYKAALYWVRILVYAWQYGLLGLAVEFHSQVFPTTWDPLLGDDIKDWTQDLLCHVNMLSQLACYVCSLSTLSPVNHFYKVHAEASLYLFSLVPACPPRTLYKDSFLQWFLRRQRDGAWGLDVPGLEEMSAAVSQEVTSTGMRTA